MQQCIQGPPFMFMALNVDLKNWTLTGCLPEVHEPAGEAGVTEEQLKHLGGADVEHLVQVESTMYLGQTHSLLHWWGNGI